MFINSRPTNAAPQPSTSNDVVFIGIDHSIHGNTSAAAITVSDSDSNSVSASESDSNSDTGSNTSDTSMNSSSSVSGDSGVYYGGYGRCFTCGELFFRLIQNDGNTF